jgi:hypothetical protein
MNQIDIIKKIADGMIGIGGILEALRQPAVISSACDEIFEQASKIDMDNDIDYGQFPL